MGIHFRGPFCNTGIPLASSLADGPSCLDLKLGSYHLLIILRTVTFLGYITLNPGLEDFHPERKH